MSCASSSACAAANGGEKTASDPRAGTTLARTSAAARQASGRGSIFDPFWPRIRPISTGLYDRVVQDHERFMRLALEEARRADAAGEVPVGAIVVLDGQVVGRGFNQPIGAVDPTAHAEIVALRDAARGVGNYRLTNAVMYVTIEPCLMCVGALVHARIGTLVFGAAEPKAGAVVSTTHALELPTLNHRVEVVGGVLADECRDVVQEFFRARRT
jgi:tRNA(adenine34) deaminase